jgi:malate permease and related proteins
VEIFWFSFNAIVPLILIVALGYLLRRLKVVNGPFIDQANKFCFNVAFPVNLFSQIVGLDLQSGVNWQLYAIVIVSVLLVVALLMLVLPRFVPGNPQRGALIQGIYRGNFLLLGYPLARNLFGEAGVGPIAMLLPVVIGLYNVLAVFILEFYDDDAVKVSKRKVLAGVITNPLIIGALAGVLFTLTRLELPLFISRATEDIGKIANPLALVLLGGQFNWQRTAGNIRLLISAVVLRMAVIPALVLAAAVLLGFRGPELGGIFIIFCAPTAISSYVMAKNMNSDAELAGQIILFTTILSGLTLFCGSYLLRALQLF